MRQSRRASCVFNAAKLLSTKPAFDCARATTKKSAKIAGKKSACMAVTVRARAKNRINVHRVFGYSYVGFARRECVSRLFRASSAHARAVTARSMRFSRVRGRESRAQQVLQNGHFETTKQSNETRTRTRRVAVRAPAQARRTATPPAALIAFSAFLEKNLALTITG